MSEICALCLQHMPCMCEDPKRREQEKLTLRDRFAMAALQGIMADSKNFEDDSIEDTANWAYRVAKAMIKEREKWNG